MKAAKDKAETRRRSLTADLDVVLLLPMLCDCSSSYSYLVSLPLIWKPRRVNK